MSCNSSDVFSWLGVLLVVRSCKAMAALAAESVVVRHPSGR